MADRPRQETFMPLHYYHQVWLVLIFGWISSYMVRVALSPVLIPLMKEFSLSFAQAGLLASAVFYSYALMQFPAGYLGDRFGKKRILILCILGWGLASLGMVAAASYAALVLVRFLTGLAQGTYFSNDRPIIAYYTPKEKAGIGQGISFMGLGVGMCLGILLAGWISDQWGWRAVFLIFSLPALVASFLIYRVIQEPPREAMVSGKSEGPPLSWIFKHRDLWLLYLGGIPGVYALWMIGAWAPAMLKEIGVQTVTAASLYASLLGLSAIPGLALTGWLSDRLVRRGKGRKGLIASEFLAIAFLLLVFGLGIRGRWEAWIMGGMIFIVGMFVWGHWAAYYSLIPEMVPQSILGTVFGFTNSIHFIGGLLAPWLTGWIKDATASFASACYGAALFALIGALILYSVRPAFRWKAEIPVTGSARE
jgi:sugar phosphate permease